MKRSRIVLLGLAGVFAGGLGYQTLHTSQPADGGEPARAAAAPVEQKNEEEKASLRSVALPQALSEKLVTVDFLGNGRERMRVTIDNLAEEGLLVVLSAGDVLSRGAGQVVVLRDTEVEVPAQTKSTAMLDTAAVSTSAGLVEARYSLSNQTYPRLRPLLAYLHEHPEVRSEVAQTAVLALTENLPVCGFAKFAPVGGSMEQVFNTTPFRVEVAAIISTLAILREIGIPEGELALTIDPQLKIEAMIDPLAHAAAMRYYNIPADQEWAYWKSELSTGDVRTRHYALYGIARFFPETAIQMLPDWARSERTNDVFRQSALLALAETLRPEAASVLSQLVLELGVETDLGQSAQQALTSLNLRLEKSAAPTFAVAFRSNAGAGVPRL